MIIEELSERVTKIEAKCEEEIKYMKLQVQRQVNLPVSCDLKLNGIPFSKSENLSGIFESICNQLNIAITRSRLYIA